ncbi:heme peroxidase [Mytilinidion resinicola]|uniref:Heme peroxidase n=1 Tax=Mytilinidion resinicola TaxID=574789 RepID=A0A6A6YJI0_9PEZI|nr:heme peroxidase [Mytilinidion resinicola]KAF2808683.1 heme peroxidase [Mytilinidion resinicola]
MDMRTGVTPPKPEELSELDALRNKIGSSFRTAAGLVNAVARPVPHGTGDGSNLPEEPSGSLLHTIESTLSDISRLSIPDIKTLIDIQQTKMSGELLDDKTYQMEGLIHAAAGLPDGSGLRTKLTNLFLTQLWNDLEHPPQSYLGGKYQYRAADGSNNSLLHPKLGAAGTPYARTVKPTRAQPPYRPDPGVVFDSLMTRKHHELHPNRISSMLFYFASIIIHDLFRTDHQDPSISLTSSYLDLSPLYGSNQDEQDLMRTKDQYNGRIKPDCFSEARLLAFPPGVGAILIMFNRFHNYTVENLAAINENGRFTKPTEPEDPKDAKAADAYKAKLVKYDEDLFQTGRLITCGLYINIVLVDYVRTILNLNRTDSNWQLNPRAIIKDGPPLGVGNQVSAEFNLVYRWHSAVSDKDEKWTQDLWDKLFPGRDAKSVGKDEFLSRLKGMYHTTPKEPELRPFADLKRNADGTYPDDGLVKILKEGVEDCANSFGANRVPAVMRAIEVLGIEQTRSWNLCSLNEFRQYFGLKPHDTFEDINSDPDVAQQLKNLYETPDQVEIYPGIVVEEAKKPLAPGAGLTPPFTVSRAVLSDAVALVRGDRFYTLDYNPKTLTNWGFAQVDTDTGIDNGCVFYKLFLRAFPDHFEENSVYAHYPLTTPDAMEEALKGLNKAHLYDFDKPKFTPHPQMILGYKAATTIMGDKDTFKVTWGKNIEFLMGSPAKDFMLAGDGPKNAQSRKMMKDALYTKDWNAEVKAYYETTTKKLLKGKSVKIADFTQVDIIRDVGNLAHLHFCSELFMLPLKTDEKPGVFTEAELYLIMSAVFALVFFDVDVAASFPLHVKAQKATALLGKLVQANVEEIKHGGVLSSVMHSIWPDNSPLKDYGKHMIERLLDSGLDVKTLVWGHILGTAGGMVANQGQLFGQTIEFFLNDPLGKEQWPNVQALAKLDTDEAFDTLMHYFLEGSRLYGETGVLREVAKAVEIQDGDRTIQLKEGDRVFVNLRSVSHDAAAFPNPEAFDPTRDIDSYVHLGSGPHECLGLPMTRVALTTMLKEVARLPGLRPALGPQGLVHKVAKEMFEGEKWPYHAYLTEKYDSYWPFPCSLKVNYD